LLASVPDRYHRIPLILRSIEKDYRREGPWTLDELITLVPEKLTVGMTPLVTPTT